MTVPQLSPEWFEQRKNRVTASLVGAILGIAPYMDRDGAMRAMVRAAHGAEPEFKGNPATEWGKANEANARLDYEMDMCQETTDAPFVEAEGWAGASPDAFVGSKGLLEIKCPYGIRQAEHPAPFKKLEDQPHYYAQVQFQLWVTKREWAHFFQWVPKDTKPETIFPDNDWLADALPRLRQFYAEFLHERDHNADAHLEPLRKIIDTPAALKAVTEYDELTEAIERATEKRKDVLASLSQMVGGKDALVSGRKLTLVEKAGAVSYAKAIRALAPDADLSAYTGFPTSYWKLS